MAKHLVIVESPAKAKTIGKILGPDYEVMPSVGHIRDLPQRSLAIDVKNGFEPRYEISERKTKVVAGLKKATQKVDDIYLASDPDREGEAISWHLKTVLAPLAKDKPFYRVSYNEITPRAVKAAFAAPRDIDGNLVNAQQGRRVIDRLVGYMVSPLLWREMKRGLSAGRVQSVALRLVCERERAIENFKPVPYWIIGAILRKQEVGAEDFVVRLAAIDGKSAGTGDKALIKTEEQAKAVLDDLEPRSMRVLKIRSREIQKHAFPPFVTSSLQQAASTFLGFSPKRTMSIAQKLYEGIDFGSGAIGLITYMRTDGYDVAPEARAVAKDFITSRYGAGFYPEKPNFYRSRQDAQGAHEAIRPTDPSRTPESLVGKVAPEELKLYDLVWRRFMASQMAPAKIAQRTAHIIADPVPGQQASNHEYIFSATASDVTFEGFMKVMKLDIRKSIAIADGKDVEADDDEDDRFARLPPLAENEDLDRVKWLNDRKETKPPKRYSEASLVKELEEKGIGRPSTYAATIETLKEREYVTSERRSLAPTELGFKVSDYLVSTLDPLFNVGFTAKMEEGLDNVEQGKEEWRELVGDFYKELTGWLPARENAPEEQVRFALAELEKVAEWRPAEKSGKRTYDDKKFYASLLKQHEEGKKPISTRQLESLVKMMLRYKDQLAGVEERLAGNGLSEMVESLTRKVVADTPPEVYEELSFLLGLDLTEKDRAFISSIESQAKAGRALSPRQLNAVNRTLINYAKKLDNSEEVLAKWGLHAKKGDLEPDTESPGLLADLAKITEWREPTKRGRRVYDDKDFYESVSRQFKEKGALSIAQRAAMRKMIARYKDQISPAAEAPADGTGEADGK